MIKVSEETQRIIVDLFCNTKLKVVDIINMIDSEEKLTLQEFYDILENYKKKYGKNICRPRHDFNSEFDKFIIDMKKQGKGFEEISKEVELKGIKLSKKMFSARYKNSLSGQEKYKEVKKLNREREAESELQKKQRKLYLKEQRNKAIEEEIYRLRKNGSTYQEITKYFNDRQIKISYEQVRQRCRRIFEKKGEPIPYYENARVNIPENISNEIFEQRNSGKTYFEIWQGMNEKGFDLTYYKVCKYCKMIYGELGLDEPVNLGRVKRVIPNEELYKLKKQGLKCTKITEMYNAQNKKVSYSYIVKTCRRLYLQEQNRIKQDENRLNIKDIMMKVAIKKKATQEQMKVFAKEVAKLYAIDLKVDYDELNYAENKDEKEIEK